MKGKYVFSYCLQHMKCLYLYLYLCLQYESKIRVFPCFTSHELFVAGDGSLYLHRKRKFIGIENYGAFHHTVNMQPVASVFLTLIKHLPSVKWFNLYAHSFKKSITLNVSNIVYLNWWNTSILKCSQSTMGGNSNQQYFLFWFRRDLNINYS